MTAAEPQELNQKVLSKIRKLLALSESSNENEATVAAGMAAELMAMHGIEAAQLAADSDEIKILNDEVCRFGRKKERWVGTLCDGITRGLGARCWWSKNQHGEMTLRMVGTPDAVSAAKYMLPALKNTIERLAEMASRSGIPLGQGESRTTFKNSFKVGCAIVIRERMIDARKSTISQHANGTALVRLDRTEAEVEAAMPRLTKSKARRVGGSGLEWGKQAGYDMELGNVGGLNAPARRLKG